jgi:starch phosphorylase
MRAFQAGDHFGAVRRAVQAERVSKLLYPSESTEAGRELRLLQEYFLVSCAMQDILERHLAAGHGLADLPQKVAVQLNDTHPALAVAELLRLLVDEHDVPFDAAWDLCRGCFAYTNHTLMPEALERWPRPFLMRVVPRHLLIIEHLNARFLADVTKRWPGDLERMQRMSIIEEGNPKHVRMAHLAIVGSHAVNGVSKLHTQLMRTSLVPDFAQLWPERFSSKTNGVSPRRWLLGANPALARLISDRIGDGWILDLARLAELESAVDDAAFGSALLQVKRANKLRLAPVVEQAAGVRVDPDAMFDVQVKRIHEYKRQLLAALHGIHSYLRLAEDRWSRRAGLLDGQAHHPLLVERGARRQRRPPHRWRPTHRVPARLQRLAGREDHPGRRSVRADLDRRDRGLRHRQHEARAQRRADDRHARRCERRDP